MTELPRNGDDRGRPKRLRRLFLTALAVFAAFGIGVALGQALHDNPRPGGASTTLRTLPASSPR